MNGSNQGLLSICCVGYNHAKYLTENIESICRIDYPKIEVIVVDDGSQDNSIELLAELKNKVSFELHVIAQKNTGNIGKNFNRALHESKGEYVTFIALDDVFNVEVIKKQIYIMNAFEDLAFTATSKTVRINTQGKEIKDDTELPLYHMSEVTLGDLLELEYSNFGAFYIQGSIFRKSIIDAISGFDEDMTGDDIVLRTKLFRYLKQFPNYNFKILKENGVFYRIHDNNIHKNSARQIKIVTEYLDRYWPDRETPKILIEWLCHAITVEKFENYIKIFTFNQRACLTLNNTFVQKAIKQSILKEYKKNSFFSKYIYRKNKVNTNNRREIVLFNCLKFSYKRSK